MPVTLLMLAAVLAGASPTLAALVLAAAVSMPLAAAGAAVLGVSHRLRRARAAPPAVDEAHFCAAVSAELHAGASLREAIAAVGRRDQAPPMVALNRAALAAPDDVVAARLAAALPRNGRHAALAFRVAAATGAGTAAVFDRLAARAVREAELSRERRSLTAQAKLSAFVVGGAPIVVTVLLAATGRLSVLAHSTAAAVVSAIGLGLVGVGLVIVWLLVREQS